MSNREEALRRVKAMRSSEAQKVLKEYLSIKVEEWKEMLLVVERERIDELRGAIKQIRLVLKEIDNDIPEKQKNHPYA